MRRFPLFLVLLLVLSVAADNVSLGDNVSVIESVESPAQTPLPEDALRVMVAGLENISEAAPLMNVSDELVSQQADAEVQVVEPLIEVPREEVQDESVQVEQAVEDSAVEMPALELVVSQEVPVSELVIESSNVTVVEEVVAPAQTPYVEDALDALASDLGSDEPVAEEVVPSEVPEVVEPVQEVAVQPVEEVAVDVPQDEVVVDEVVVLPQESGAANESVQNESPVLRNATLEVVQSANLSELRRENGTGGLVDAAFVLRDAGRNELAASVRVVDPRTGLVVFESGRGVAAAALEVPEGLLDMQVVLDAGPVKSIEFKEVLLNSSSMVGIDDLPESASLARDWLELYAIDPTGLNFTRATVTAVAKGTTLMKCKEWNFTARSCGGDWAVYATGLVPGQEYTFELTPNDPGFGEVSPDEGTPDAGVFDSFGDGAGTITGTFTDTQVNDGTYFAARRSNTGGNQLDLHAYLNLSYNLTPLVSGGVNTSKIFNLTFLMEHCFNDDISGGFACGGGAPGGTIQNPLGIDLFNWTSGQYVRVGTYTGSSINEGNATVTVASSLSNYINATTNLVMIRYIGNVTIVTNGNDAAFGVDFAPLTVAFDNVTPAVILHSPAVSSTFNVSSTIEIAANVTDSSGVSNVTANVTLPNGTIRLVNLTLAVGSKYNASFVIPNLAGLYNVTFRANDSRGNVNITVTTNFTAQGFSAVILSVNQTTYRQGTSATPEENPNFGLKNYIPFQARLFDALNGSASPLGSGSCSVVSNRTGAVTVLAFNSSTGNYTGLLDTVTEFANTTYTVTCTAPQYSGSTNATTANIYWISFLVEIGNRSFGGVGNNLSVASTWLSKVEPNTTSVFNKTFAVSLVPNATNVSVATFFFCGSNTLVNCSFLKNYNFRSGGIGRLNASASINNACTMKFCTALYNTDLQLLGRNCENTVFNLTGTPTVYERNGSANATVPQGFFLAGQVLCDAGAAVVNATQVNVSVYYNYSGEPVNFEAHHPEPNVIGAQEVAHMQSRAQYSIGPNERLIVTMNHTAQFNNSLGSTQFLRYFNTLEVLLPFKPSLIPNRTIVYNSTGQVWASDNSSLGAPRVVTIQVPNDVVIYDTEFIPSFMVVNETTQVDHSDALRDSEFLVENSSGRKQWQVNVSNIFANSITIFNVTAFTNYSSYGVPDDFAIFVSVTNTTGTFNVTNLSIVNQTAKTITFPRQDIRGSLIGAIFDVVAIDRTAPNVTDVRPVNNTVFSGSNIIEIAANVSDNTGVDSVSVNVTLPNGAIQVVSLSLAAGNKYNSSFTIPVEGSYNVTFVANDTVNNVNASVVSRFTYDNSSPLVTVIYPLGHNISTGSVVGLILNITDASSVDNITATVVNPNGTISITSNFSRGLASDNFTNNTVGTNWLARNDSLAPGQTCTKDIDVSVPDKMFISIAGTSASSVTHCGFNSYARLPGDFDVIVDFNVTGSGDDVFFSFRSNSDDSLFATGSRVFVDWDNTTGSPRYVLGYSTISGTTQSVVPTTDTVGRFRITRSNATFGNENRFNLQYFNFTNSSWADPLGSFIINTTRAQVMQLKATSTASAYGPIAVEVDSVSVVSDGTYIISFNQTDVLGVYNVSFFVNDTLGFVNNTQNTTFNITQGNSPPSRPFLVEPDAGDVINGVFNITWTQVVDAEGDNLFFNITLLNPNGSFNATIVNDLPDVPSPVTSYAWNTSLYPEGEYGLRVSVYQNVSGNANNENSDNLSGTFRIDRTAPAVTLLSPANASVFLINDSVNITANATDVNGFADVSAIVTFPDGTNQSVAMSNSSGIYGVLFTNLTQKGNYTVRVRATDAGLTSNETIVAAFTRVVFGNGSFDAVGPDGQPLSYTQTVLSNVSGVLAVRLDFTNHTILQVNITDYTESSPFAMVRIANSTSDSTRFARTYAVDLSSLNFTVANVSAVAVGNTLYKCVNYTFSTTTCNDGYEFLTSITPGSVYIITVNSTDPGFGDASPDTGTPDAGNYVAFDDGFSTTVNTFTATQANDATYFAVRRINGGGAQLDLEAYLNLSYNLSNLTSQGVTAQKIKNATFVMEHCFNDDIAGAFTCGGGAPGGTIENPLGIDLLNWTSGQYVRVATYTGSSVTEGNATTIVLAGFSDYLNSSTSFVNVRYTVNVTIVTNGNDAAFGADFAPLTVVFDNLGPNVTNVTAVPTIINLTQFTNISANVTDSTAVDVVRANITFPNGSNLIQQMTLGSGIRYSVLFTANATFPAGVYNVTIIANDTLGNVNSTERTNFTVNAIFPQIVTFKTDSPDPVARGAQLNYVIFINNTGNSTAENVTVVESYPSGVVFHSSSPSPTSGNDTFALGNFSAGQSTTVNITVNVSSALANGTVLNNSYNVTFVNITGANVTVTNSTTTSVLGAPVVVSIKSDSPDPVVKGSQLNYTILINNTGDDTAFNVTLLEFYPAGVVFHSSSPVPTSGNSTFSLGSLSPNASILVNITVNVSAALANGTVLVNQVNVSFQNVSGSNATNGDSESTTVVGFPTILTTKVDAPDPVLRGTTLRYVITVNNTGDEIAYNISVVDLYPANVSFNGSTPAPSSGNDTFSVGALLPNESTTINITVNVSAALANGTVLNNSVSATFANVSGQNQTSSDSELTDVRGERNITITKSDSPDPTKNGTTVTYTITVENVGDDTAFNITVLELYPVNVTFNGSSPAPIIGNHTFSLGDVSPGNSTTINITLNVSSTMIEGILNNTVFANASNFFGTNQTVNVSESTTITPSGVNVSNISLVKSDVPDPVVRGAQLNYTIFVNSTGNATAFNVTVLESYPSGVIFHSASPAPSSGNNTFVLGNITNGSSTTINITVNVSAALVNGTVLNNSVSASFQDEQNDTLISETSELTTVRGIPSVFTNKVDSPDPVPRGAALSYQLIVNNTGDEIAYNVTVVETYPANVTFNGSEPAPSSGNNTFSIGNLSPSSSFIVNITLNVSPSAANGSVLNNSYNLTFANLTGASVTVTNSTTTTVQGIPVVVSIKSDSPDPVVKGQQLNYTILVNNTGDEVAYNVTVTEVYPFNVTFVSSSPAPVSGNDTFNVGSLAPGQSTTVNITVNVSRFALNGTVLNNSVNATFTNLSGVNATASDFELTTVLGFPEVFANKLDSPDPVARGSSLTYQIVINNTGDEVAYNVSVFDFYPQNVTFDSSEPSPSSGNNTFSVGNLSPSTSFVINITVNVSASAPNGSILNNSFNATFTNNSGVNLTITNSTTTTVLGAPVAVSIKSDSPDPVVKGSQLNYTILVNNTGDDTAFNVTLLEFYPAGVVFHSGQPSPSGNNSFSIGTLAPSQSFLVNITVNVSGILTNGTVLVNNVNVSFQNVSGSNATNGDSEATTVVGFPTIITTKTDDPDPVPKGTTLAYQIVINNTGDEIAYNVSVVELYPANVTFNGSSTAPSSGNDTFSLGSIAPGGFAALNITVNVSGSAVNGSILNNSYTVTFANNSGVNATVTNSTLTAVQGSPVVVSVKSDSPDPVVKGQQLNYTILVNNTGDEVAYNVTVTEVYPSAVSFSNSAPAPSSGNATFSLGNLSPGQSATVNITVNVSRFIANGSILNNSVSAAFTNVSGAIGASSDSELTTVLGFPELFANKLDSPDPVPRGTTLTYQIVINNTGDEVAYNVSVFDLYPQNVVFNGSQPSPSSGNNTFSVGNLLPGASFVINITVNVSSLLSNGTVLNNSFNATFANNSGVNLTITNSTTTTVLGTPFIVNIKSDSPDPVIRGTQLNYSIFINNTGDDTAFNVSLLESYPSGVVFHSSSPVPSSGNDTFSLGALLPNQSTTINITVNVSASVTNGTVLNNSVNASFVNSTGQSSFSADTESTTVQGIPVLAVDKSDLSDPVENGTQLNYTVTIQNTGDEIAYNVTMIDTYPVNVTFHAASPAPISGNDTFSLGNVLPGVTTTVNISVNVSSVQPNGSLIFNTVNVTFANLTGSNASAADTENTTVVNVSDETAPQVFILTPANGTSYFINESVNISANVTDTTSLHTVQVNVTLPNGSVIVLPMTNVGTVYSVSFTNLTQRGNYTFRIHANDSFGNLNDSRTGFFSRVPPAGRVLDVVDEFGQPVQFNESILSNLSGVLSISLQFFNHTVLTMSVVTHNEASPFNVVRIANNTVDQGRFSRTFAVDLGDLNFTSANVSATAIGNVLYKCANFTMSSTTCNDGYEIIANLTAGQNYTITLNATDPGFGDQSPDNGTPDAGNYVAVDDGFSATFNTFVATQANDAVYFAVRRTNGAGTQLDLESFLNLSYNLSNLTVQGLTAQKIKNMSFLLEHCYNNDVIGVFTCGGVAPGGTIESPLRIEIFNFTSGEYQLIGTYTGSSVTESNATAFTVSGFQDFINSSTNFTNIRYTVNVTVVVNGNDAAFGADFAQLTITFDIVPPNVTLVSPQPNSVFNATSSIQLAVNVTDDFTIDTVVANITFPNGTSQLVPLALALAPLYNASFTIPDLAGLYNVTFIVNDTAGNVNSSVTTNFTAVLVEPVILTVKADAPDPVVKGTQLNYTINITNAGNGTAFNVTVVDLYPAGVVFHNSSPAPTVGNGTFLLGNFSPGSSFLLNITVNVSPLLANGTVLNNSYNVTAGNSTGVNITVSNSTLTSVRGIPSIITNKSDSPDPVFEGQTLRYQILVNNTGDEIAYNVTVVDIYPANVTFNGSQPAPSSGNNTFIIGSIRPQSSFIINITVNVSTVLTNGSILNNSYNVTFANLSGQNATVENSSLTTVLGNAVVVLVKADAPDPVVKGGQLTYTILVNNTGDGDAFNITVRDIYPQGVVFHNSSPAPTSGNGTFFVGNLAPNASTTINITVNVSSSLANGSVINNTVNSTFNNSGGLAFTSSDTEGTTVLGFPRLTVAKADSPNPVLNGSTLSYSITITNTGDDVAYNITAVESYPENVTFNGSQPAPSAGNDTFSIGNLTPGAVFVLNITVNVSPNMSGVLVNNVSVTFANVSGQNLTVNDTESTTVVSVLPSSGGQGGGGGGGGSAGTGETHWMNVENWTSPDLRRLDKVLFMPPAYDHTLTILGVASKQVRLRVSSPLQEFTLAEGRSLDVDADLSGSIDVRVSVVSVTNDRVVLNLKRIAQEPSVYFNLKPVSERPQPVPQEVSGEKEAGGINSAAVVEQVEEVREPFKWPKVDVLPAFVFMSALGVLLLCLIGAVMMAGSGPKGGVLPPKKPVVRPIVRPVKTSAAQTASANEERIFRMEGREFTHVLRANDKVLFIINDVRTGLCVHKVSGKVTIQVGGATRVFTAGEELRFDADRDGSDDIAVKVTAVSRVNVKVSMRKLPAHRRDV